MKFILSILQIVFVFSYTISYAQTLEASLLCGGTFFDHAYSIERAPNGDVFMVGRIADTLDINPNDTASIISSPYSNYTNGFIARYDANMDLIWAVTMGGDKWDQVSDIILDDSLNVYVIGYGGGNIDFNPSNDIDTLDLGEGNGFIAKYGSDGVFIAVNETVGGSSLFLYPTSFSGKKGLLRDELGNLFVFADDTLSKYTSDLELIWTENISFGPQVINTSEINSLRSIYNVLGPMVEYEIVLDKYSSVTGGLLDSLVYGYNDGWCTMNSLNKMQNGDLMLYGHYWGDLVFYDDNDTIEFENYNYLPDGVSNMSNAFICRYSSSGNLLWAKTIEGEHPYPHIIEEDQNGNIYVSGKFENAANFSTSTPVIHVANCFTSSYIAKYDSTFNYIGMSQVIGDHSNINDLLLFEDTAYLCGDFEFPIDIDITLGEDSIETNGLRDIFVLKYSDFENLTNESEPISIEEHIGDNTFFKVYSKVFGNTIQINISESLSAEHVNRISIYNIEGKVLKTIESSSKTIEFDISSFPKAMYLVEVSNAKWSATEKIIKAN